MTKNGANGPKARARARQERNGGKYTEAARGGAETDVLDPEPDNPKAHAWCPRCRYAYVLHRHGRCPEPAVFRVEEQDFDGPHWGGGLHSHGTSVSVIARADGGRGQWLTPDLALGGPDTLKGALRPDAADAVSTWVASMHDDQPSAEAAPDMPYLLSTLGKAFPGAAEGPFSLDAYADVDTEPVNLVEREFMWDCDDDYCRDD